MRDSSSKTTSLFTPSRTVAALKAVMLATTLAGAPLDAARAQSPATPVVAAAPSAEVGEIQRLIKTGQNAQALKLIDESLVRNPKDASMRFRRGVTLSMLDRKAEALTVFQKLVEDHPEMPSPYNNLAVLYGSQGEYDKARSALEKAIRTNPAYATAYQNLGDVYAQLASQAYSRALQLDKTDTTVPPKLALLRELVTTPAVPTATTTVATLAATVREPVPAVRPVQVAAATPAPAPAQVHLPPPPPPPPAPTQTPPPAPAPRPATAPPPAPRPAAEPAAAKPAASSNAIAEVDAAVRGWASAWSRRDMNAYLGAYTGEFAGSTKSHKAWEDDRKARIAPRKHISVEISDLRVSVTGDKAQAHFRQSYESDSLTTSGHKTLDLVRAPGGKWLIRQESVGG